MKKIGFTGTQRGMSPNQRHELLLLLSNEKCEFHHGDCIGADEEAHLIATNCGCTIYVHPPENSSKRAFCKAQHIRELKPYLKRNQDIIDETDFIIAAPKSEKYERRSGTWWTIKHANKIGKKVIILKR